MKEAARRNDRYGCKSHGSGVIDGSCEAGILINGLPAARLASKATCPHAPDMIGAGASAVLFNGLPAARVADTTLHRGVIVEPCARGVVIESPTFSVPYNIIIDGDQDFQSKVVRDLYFISTTRSGHELLVRLESSGQYVVIVSSYRTRANTFNDFDEYNGIPCGTTVEYNPEYYTISRGPDGEPFYIAPQEALLHESLHALQNAEGKSPNGMDPALEGKEKTHNGESLAIGIGTYESAYPTENTFREDLGLKPPRATHVLVAPVSLERLPERPNFRPGGP